MYIFSNFKIAVGVGLFTGLLLFASSSNAGDPEALFDEHCGHCHNPKAPNIERDEDLYPSLFDIARTRTARQMAVAIVNGKFDRAGERNGRTNPTMPAHDYLANETIADLINFVREGARVAGRITAETVAAVRGDNEDTQGADLTDLEYAAADSLYQDRCAGCHAVDRSGRSGSSLQTWAIASSGREAAKLAIHFGTPWGMPNWGMSDELSAEEISLLVRYLSEPSRGLPVLRFQDVVDNWQESGARRPRRAQRNSVARLDDLFVSLLHDTGQVVLIDGRTREIREVAEVVLAPSVAVRSKDGRYLYVMSRSAEVVLFDLGTVPVLEVARVKIGFEGRSLTLSDNGDSLAVGAYWPPQIVQLSAANLKPEALLQIDDQAYARNTTDAEITQLLPMPGSREILALTKAAGEFLILDPEEGVRSREFGYPFLRAGSTDTTGRYLLTPADDEMVVVFDLVEQRVSRRLDARGLIGGSMGTSFVSPQGRNLWITSGLGTGSFFIVETEGEPAAWVTTAISEPAWDGSLNIVSHAQSGGIWVDFPLSRLREQSQSIAVLNKSAQLSTQQILNAVEMAGLTGSGLARAVHPQFNKAGTQVWITIWNRQDENSAILILDAKTYEAIEVIKDSRLITPIRTLSLPAH